MDQQHYCRILFSLPVVLVCGFLRVSGCWVRNKIRSNEVNVKRERP